MEKAMRVTNKMIVERIIQNQYITPENINQMAMEEAYSAIREDAGIAPDHHMHLNSRTEKS